MSDPSQTAPAGFTVDVSRLNELNTPVAQSTVPARITKPDATEAAQPTPAWATPGTAKYAGTAAFAEALNRKQADLSRRAVLSAVPSADGTPPTIQLSKSSMRSLAAPLFDAVVAAVYDQVAADLTKAGYKVVADPNDSASPSMSPWPRTRHGTALRSSPVVGARSPQTARGPAMSPVAEEPSDGEEAASAFPGLFGKAPSTVKSTTSENPKDAKEEQHEPGVPTPSSASPVLSCQPSPMEAIRTPHPLSPSGHYNIGMRIEQSESVENYNLLLAQHQEQVYSQFPAYAAHSANGAPLDWQNTHGSWQNQRKPDPPGELPRAQPPPPATQPLSPGNESVHCKHWVTKGMCRMGTECKFLHDPSEMGRNPKKEKKKWKPPSTAVAPRPPPPGGAW